MNVTTERLAPRGASQLAAILSLHNSRLFLFAVALSIAPLWFGPYLPMVDVPQHAAQITALRQLWHGDPAFAALFEINWFTPYLLGYLLLYVVALVLPVTVAVKVVVSLAIVSIPLLTGALLRGAGADERWKWLAIPGSYSFAFYWGFLSYMVAVPFALLFLVLTFQFDRKSTISNGLVVAVSAIFLFFCHAIVLAFTSVLALGYLAAGNYRDIKALALRALPYTAPLPIIAAWLLITHTRESSVQNAAVVYGSVLDRFFGLLTQPVGMDFFYPLICSIVMSAIVLLPWLAGSRFSRRPERWAPFALAVLIFFAVPAAAFNTGFLYHRLGGFLVPLWFMVWDPPSRESRRLDWIAMLVVVVWTFSNAGRFAAFARETESFSTILTRIEPGKKVGSLIKDNSSQLFAAPVYMHFVAWYQASHHGIVDFNFAVFYPQMVRYKSQAEPRIDESLAWYPTAFRWDVNGGRDYDYFLVRSNADIAEPLFKEKTGAVRLIARSGWWWLYKNTER